MFRIVTQFWKPPPPHLGLINTLDPILETSQGISREQRVKRQFLNNIETYRIHKYIHTKRHNLGMYNMLNLQLII